MSARVLHPSLLSDFCRMRSPVRSAAHAALGGHHHCSSAGGPASPSRPALAKVKRDLFGSVEKDDNKKFFDTEIGKHQQIASERWGFNFARGHPLADHPQYAWERVPPTPCASVGASGASAAVAHSSAIPHMFTLTAAAHVRPTTASGTQRLLRSPRKSPRSPAAQRAAVRLAARAFLGYDDDLLDERARRQNEATQPAALLDTSGDCSSEGDLNSSGECIENDAPMAANIIGGTGARLSLTITATPVGCSKPTLRSSTRQQRQPRITDYLKERKRLSATPKKVSPSKRTRLSSGLSRVA